MSLEEENLNSGDKPMEESTAVSGLYKDWFLDYASYVILERAVPHIHDGFKPVQRRIMHALNEMDDGRFNKVANIIGATMQYHPHGDASIGDAMVNLGQKDLLIDTQGNWGDVRTGDSAAAPRYIEARLSKFSKEVVFNPQTTEWQASYDGRKKEPITLPLKFPLLLASGIEGIAVGLATKILPHNFIELIDASIKILKGKKATIVPDFPTGGVGDFSNYNDGQKGGRIRVRAKIQEQDKKNLIITEIPYGTTTSSLIDSIIKANDQGKIKIKKVTDNTAKNVEIQIQLAPNTSPDITIDALYAFTDCEISISPNACVIVEDKPHFLAVSDILRISTERTKGLLKRELEIRRGELMEKIMFSSLEKLFIQDEMYIDFKEYDNKPALFEYLSTRFDPYKAQFYREITDEDYEKLTQIPMIRITRFDTAKADEKMKKLQDELDQVNYDLEHLTDFAIRYFENLKEKFGKGRERKTEISTFETIDSTIVAASNVKLYVNRQDGFVGYGLKKDEYVCDCSDIDDVIVFTAEGIAKVVKIADKVFAGKNIIHVGVFKKGDDRMVYNMAYKDGKSGTTYGKRFNITSVTREKEYDLTKGNKGSKVWHFSANPNGEAEIVTVYLTSGSKARKKVFDFDFAELGIKGRGSQGNIITKQPVRKVVFKAAGKSTLGGIDIWYDETIGRLNTDERGSYLGNFEAEDRILVLYKTGEYELTNFDITNKYDTKAVIELSKWSPKAPITAIHQDANSGNYLLKRFLIETSTLEKTFSFIAESEGSKLLWGSAAQNAKIIVNGKKEGEKTLSEEEIDVVDFIEIKGWKALGNKLYYDRIKTIDLKEGYFYGVEKNDGTDKEDEELKTGTTVELKINKNSSDDEDDEEQLGLF